jgi:type II secretory pathway component PulM
MDELLAQAKNWFRGLARREQYAVLAGAGAILALLVFAAWMPVERRVSRLEDSVRTKQADLVWLQSVAPQLGALRNAPSNSGGPSLVVLVDGVARETGIARSVAGSQPGDDGTLSVRLEQVPFDSLINWAGELVQHHGVRVVSANIDGGAAVGQVSASFVLRGP